jgi:hypothetical protein
MKQINFAVARQARIDFWNIKAMHGESINRCNDVAMLRRGA